MVCKWYNMYHTDSSTQCRIFLTTIYQQYLDIAKRNLFVVAILKYNAIPLSNICQSLFYYEVFRLIASKKSCLTTRDEHTHNEEDSSAASAENYSGFEIIQKRDRKKLSGYLVDNVTLSKRMHRLYVDCIMPLVTS